MPHADGSGAVMLERLGQVWRGLATGLCFAIFGLGELLLAFTVFPFLLVFMRNETKRSRVAKALLHHSFRAFVWLMKSTGGLDYETRHLERLKRPGLLVLANHPSLIDIVFLISFIRQADCIVKDALINNPFTRYAILACGFIRNADKEALLENCGKSMRAGNVLIVFPEGTRSEPDHMREFKRGAAHIAVRTQRDITPVVIRANEHNLGRDSHWWKPPKKPMHFEFEVGEDIPVRPFREKQPEAPATARELTRYLTQHFWERVNGYRAA